MKKLTTECSATGLSPARVHDYGSGTQIGTELADWDQYRAWSEGPSDVCEARRCLNPEAIKRLAITPETVIFLID